MTLKIKAYSDFVCAWCFVGKFPLAEAIKDKDVEIEWMPYELSPSPGPTVDIKNDPVKSGGIKSIIFPIAKELGVTMNLPPVSPNPYTHLAFEGYQYAKAHGKGGAYIHRVFGAYYQEEKDIGKVSVLISLAAELGFDEMEFKKALETRRYQEAHQKALHHAYYESGVRAVPTYIIGNQVLQGFHRKEAIEMAIQKELDTSDLSKTEGESCRMDDHCL
ncbi:Predicted dithiol-disulfide isomerase, DsbA family [Paenibacillus sp. cl141a]|uniref:DsbA family oxidoreductase n=1 Tax=Paenibacillus sp. cl141a TaxID=1761877 RepID=UPI0008D5DD6A|nr:DsbA family oxidoreductase [Paenibacillus sp. cl141a]SEL96051.1 Predicted dithiol-disulfide isomerase, DsbA family [Paenibacillus sp. cl141a]